MDMWIAIGCLVICILLGLSLAWYNMNDEEGVKHRIEARRAQRKKRNTKWLGPK